MACVMPLCSGSSSSACSNRAKASSKDASLIAIKPSKKSFCACGLICSVELGENRPSIEPPCAGTCALAGLLGLATRIISSDMKGLNRNINRFLRCLLVRVKKRYVGIVFKISKSVLSTHANL